MNAISKVNEEIRIRWTGSARYDLRQAEWALRYAASFVSEHAMDKPSRTGLRRGVFLTGGTLRRHQTAHVYFTTGGVVVVRIHGAVEVTT